LDFGADFEWFAILLRLSLRHQSRKVALPQPGAEVAVEFFRRYVEGTLQRLVDGAAERVAIFVDEVPQTFPSILLLDVLEYGVPEAIREVTAALGMRDLRHLIVDHRVTQDHPVLRVLVLSHERRETFHEPQRRIGGDRLAELPLEKDLVFEDVR